MSGKRKEGAARHRKFYVPLYADARFRSLSAPQPNAQTLYQYLLYGPHVGRIPGLFTLTRGDLADRLGWSVAQLDKIMVELKDAELAVWSWEHYLVWLPDALAHDPPMNLDQLRGWRGYWLELQDCPLKASAAASIRSFFASHRPWRNFQLDDVAVALDDLMAANNEPRLPLRDAPPVADWRALLRTWFEASFWPLFPASADGTKWETEPAFGLMTAAFIRWHKIQSVKAAVTTPVASEADVVTFGALLLAGLRRQLDQRARRSGVGNGFVAGWPGLAKWLKEERWTVQVSDADAQPDDNELKARFEGKI